MSYIPKKTLEDLEFYDVLNQISKHAKTLIGKEQCQNIRPFDQCDENLLNSLDHVSEYRSSFDNENIIPDHFFNDGNSTNTIGVYNKMNNKSNFSMLFHSTSK